MQLVFQVDSPCSCCHFDTNFFLQLGNLVEKKSYTHWNEIFQHVYNCPRLNLYQERLLLVQPNFSLLVVRGFTTDSCALLSHFDNTNIFQKPQNIFRRLIRLSPPLFQFLMMCNWFSNPKLGKNLVGSNFRTTIHFQIPN